MKKEGTTYKVIVDTNIWISFLIGKSLQGLQKYIDLQKVSVITCSEQLQELADVFQRPKIKKYFTSEQIVEFFELFEESSVVVDVKTKTNICRDSKDNYLLSLAVDSNADFLITGDNDLLILEKVENTNIIKFSEFENSVGS